MKTMITAICVLAALAVARAEDPEGPAITTYPASAFVFNATAAPANAATAGGFSDKRMVTQWPTTNGMGISMTAFTLQPCALRPPHIHQYATGLLYVSSASNLSVGFTSINGTGISNAVSTGAATLFPQGLTHYQQNLGCDVASYTITYNSDNPGTQLAFPGILGLPASVVTATLSNPNITAIMAAPTSDFIANSDADCVQRCARSTSTAGK